MRATVVGGAADAWSWRRAPERRGEGSEAGGGAAGNNGEKSPRPREGGDSLQKMPYSSGTVAQENPTRGRATKSVSSAPGRAERKGELCDRDSCTRTRLIEY